jgi:hypothetical protein
VEEQGGRVVTLQCSPNLAHLNHLRSTVGCRVAMKIYSSRSLTCSMLWCRLAGKVSNRIPTVANRCSHTSQLLQVACLQPPPHAYWGNIPDLQVESLPKTPREHFPQPGTLPSNTHPPGQSLNPTLKHPPIASVAGHLHTYQMVEPTYPRRLSYFFWGLLSVSLISSTHQPGQ